MKVDIEDITNILKEAGEDTYLSNRSDQEKCYRISQIEDIAIKLCKLIGFDHLQILDEMND